MSDSTTHLDALAPETGSELVSLARRTVRRCTSADDPAPVADDVPDADLGAFVTIERGERLRGCCGLVQPNGPLARTVVDAAVDAARNDPRCPPVRADELLDLSLTVTVLSPPAPVTPETPATYPEHIEVGRHGLVVADGDRRGLLLPQVAVDRGWTARALLTATCQKAGVPGDAWRRGAVDVHRFSARTFTERRPLGEVVERLLRGTAETDEDGEVGTADDGGDDGAGSAPWPVPDGGAPAAGVRSPVVAGQFYPAEPEPLRERLAGTFAHELGPGRHGGGGARDDALRGVVVPHAALRASGPVAAHAYAALAANPPETVVLLGPNHDAVGPPAAVAPHEAWATPLGEVPVDGALASALVAAGDVATHDEDPHRGEHSLEVQLPLLQDALDRQVDVVPVCLSRAGPDRARALGRAVAAAAERVERDVAVVASTDLTHYRSQAAAEAADRPVVDALADLDDDEVARQVAEEGHTMCGPWAAVAGLTAARELGAEGGERLSYATSGDVTGRTDRVVGYTAVALR